MNDISSTGQSTRNYSGLTSRFDHLLKDIPHYVLYPEMMAAVGAHYGERPVKLLVLGESHYCDVPEPGNTPEAWYERRDLQGAKAARNMSTRGVFNNAILGKNPSKSKAIFHALANALDECGCRVPEASSALQSIAYMNFFQRPAERTGKSIRVDKRDVVEANRVLSGVAAVLKPDVVVFASRLAARFGKEGIAGLHGSGIRTAVVPHPASAWWNRPSGPMGGQTGRDRFIEAVKEARPNTIIDGLFI